MTKRQIAKKLQVANLTAEVLDKESVEVCVGYHENENNGHVFGSCDYDATEELASKVAEALGWKHSYKTGYGAVVVTSYEPNIDYGNCQ